MDFEKLGLKIGIAMQLQREGDARRYVVRLIGIEPRHGVIVTPPRDRDGKTLFLREGQNVIVRFAMLNSVMAFETKVLEDKVKPYPHVHLAIPKEIESIEVRRAARIETDMQVTVINETTESAPIVARLADLSPIGARVESQKELAEKGNLLSLSFTVKIAHYEYTLTIRGTVVAAGAVDETNTGQPYYLGVQFHPPDEEDAAPLYAYVYQELLAELNFI